MNTNLTLTFIIETIEALIEFEQKNYSESTNVFFSFQKNSSKTQILVFRDNLEIITSSLNAVEDTRCFYHTLEHLGTFID